MLTFPPPPAIDRPWLRTEAWRWVLAAFVSLCLTVIAVRTVEWAVIANGFQAVGSSPAVVAGAIALYAGAFVLRAVAWGQLLQSTLSLRERVSNLHAGLFLNHLLPFKAGELARPLLAARHGVPSSEAVATSVVARALDFVCLVTIAVVVVPGVWGAGGIGLAFQAATAFTFAGAGVLLLIARGVSARWIPARILGRVEVLSEGLRAIPMRAIAVAVPLVALSWLMEGAMVWAAADLLGVSVALNVAFGATALTILCQTIHVTPGGLGIYEAAMTAVLVSFGMPGETALEVALFTHGMKFAYAFAAGGAFGLGEGIYVLRGRAGAAPKFASRLEICTARLWNVLNEGKPFTPVFSVGVVAFLMVTGLLPVRGIGAAFVAGVAVMPLALLWWRFDFPLKLRWALWAYLCAFVALTQAVPVTATVTVLAAYLGFTVVLWGTVYYHLRIGTPWSNGFRFARLVAENPDPTSGNLLEQVPKVLLLVFAFSSVASAPGAASVATLLAFTGVVAITAFFTHRWFFTWVPALPQPRLTPAFPALTERKSRRVIAIVIDGCRADRLMEARTPCIDRLRREGADFRNVSTVYPARTVTCFSSMLTGASPAVHGMRSNFVPSLGVKCESLFDVLRANRMSGVLVGIAHLIDAFGARDVRPVTAVMDNDAIDDALIAEGKRVLTEEDPELLVLQLLSVDQTGHARGSYNPEYLQRIEDTDRKIESFLHWCGTSGFLDGATIVITADHGQGIGIGGHGHMTPPEITIPAILWGEGVAAGRVDFEQRFITDFAPTIASLLGVPAPGASVGRNLLEQSIAEADRPVVFIVPAHNEAESLPSVLRRINESGIRGTRTIVVDDGSTDGTVAIANALGATVVSHQTNRGLGAALRTGLATARETTPRAVVYLDADGEYDPAEARRLLAPIEAGEADYVLGSRFASGRPDGMTFARAFANRAFSAVLSVLALRRISDGQTGFRAFSPRAADVAEIVHDYNYAQVLTLNLVHKGMRMAEVPITYRRRTHGRSFVSSAYLWKVPLGMMREMLRA